MRLTVPLRSDFALGVKPLPEISQSYLLPEKRQSDRAVMKRSSLLGNQPVLSQTNASQYGI